MERGGEIDRNDHVPVFARKFLDRRDMLDSGVVTRMSTEPSFAAASPMPSIITFAPPLASARAMAKPMPLVEPVTMALRVLRVMSPPGGRKEALAGIAMLQRRGGKDETKPLVLKDPFNRLIGI
jgi:hypothetical protein